MAAGALRRHLDADDDSVAARSSASSRGLGPVKATVMRGRSTSSRCATTLLRAGAQRDELPGAVGQASRSRRRSCARRRSGDASDALAHLEREHGLTGITARRAWRGASVRAHRVHHHETALWRARAAGRFVALDEPESLDPTEARAEIFRRYLTAFGPASRQDIRAWAMMRVPEITRALERLEPLRRFRDENGRELLDVPARRCRTPTLRRPFASCRSGTTCCSRGRSSARAAGALPKERSA